MNHIFVLLPFRENAEHEKSKMVTPSTSSDNDLQQNGKDDPNHDMTDLSAAAHHNQAVMMADIHVKSGMGHMTSAGPMTDLSGLDPHPVQNMTPVNGADSVLHQTSIQNSMMSHHHHHMAALTNITS